MSSHLPPPDPWESTFGEAQGVSLLGPTTVFTRGRPSPRAERLADAIVAARPGILFVVASDGR